MQNAFLRRLRQSDHGSSAVEFAMVAPFLIAILFGIFEFGRALWTQSMLDFAVEQASRCATVNATTCGTSNQIATYASQQTAPLNLPVATFTASSPACGHQVRASYAFTFITPHLFPYSITLTSQSCYPA
jgi:Flp pilus assembly protein TadG